VTFLVAAGNGAIADVCAAKAGGRLGVARRSGIFALGLLVAAFAYGLVRVNTLAVEPGPRVLIIQPSIPQNVKNASDHDAAWRLRKMAELTEGAARPGAQDL